MPRFAPTLQSIVLAADLAGTIVFAVEGALLAIAARLDLLGIIVVAFVTALGGGVLRDILLGDAPPAAFRDGRYVFAVLLGAVVAILAGAVLKTSATTLLVLDAAGLGLFTAAGAEKAIAANMRPFATIFLATLTATGGGVARDVLLAKVPGILNADFYATAALLGAIVILLTRAAGAPPRVSALAGCASCFVLRLLGILLHWHLPIFG